MQTVLPAEQAPTNTAPSLAELTAASFKIGCLGFGGPAGQIALMHRVFVEEKKWVDEARYLHALNYCMLLPGPEAQQLATYVGWLLQGVRGGIIAGALFVLPGAVIVFGLSWLYVAAGHLSLVAAAFFGIKAAVFALVADAMIRIGRRALKGLAAFPIAIASFLALYLWSAPFPFVIVGAAAIGLLMAITSRGNATDNDGLVHRAAPPAWRALATAAAWSAAWLAPLALSLSVLGPNHVLTKVGQLFSTLSVVTFGGAYATLAYLNQQAVEVHGWLTPGQMIDGLGLAETTPGPLVLVNQFVGFVAGWESGGLALAATAAAMASWCTFAPSFVWIFAGAPFSERLRTNRWANAIFKAITAAVLGVIANLAIWFALHVLFATFTDVVMPLGARLLVPEWATFQPAAAALCVAASLALFRFRLGVVKLVLAAAASGAGLSLLGLA